MKVIKGNNACLFENLDFGTVFLSETGDLFKEIDNPCDSSLICLNIEEGLLDKTHPTEVISGAVVL